MQTDVSVVIATFNRRIRLEALVGDIENQCFPQGQLELIIVDDGSTVPVSSYISSNQYSYPINIIRQKNHGPSHARGTGISRSNGDIVLLLDDDMRISKNFVTSHFENYTKGVDVVLGRILPPAHLDSMPLFERFHLYQFSKWSARFANKRNKVEGVYFCTGNVSFRKTAYLEVGGFDHNLAQSEDRDLGIRMVSAGKRIEFCLAAASVHNSPHTSFKTWLQRAFNYGVWDTRISKKYPDYTKASPWLLVASCNRFSKPILLISIVIPNLGSLVRCGMMLVSSMFEKLGLETFALKCYSIIWSTEYLRGVTQEFGHPLEAIRDYKNFAKKVR